MKDHLDKIENKIDKLDSRLDNIDVTLASQHVSLKEHIRRTEILESDVAPIKKHVAMVHGGFKLIGLLCTIGMAAEAVYSFFRK